MNQTSLDSVNNVFGTTTYTNYTKSLLNWYTNIRFSTFNTTTRIAYFANTGDDYIINGVTYNVVVSCSGLYDNYIVHFLRFISMQYPLKLV